MLVTDVSPVADESVHWPNTKWTVKYRDLNNKADLEANFDAVIVCNGCVSWFHKFNKFTKSTSNIRCILTNINLHFFRHLSRPRIPVIKNIESFSGIAMHSHNYRRPEDFVNKTVLILGASVSGIDVSFEVTKFAKLVYLSHNKKEK